MAREMLFKAKRTDNGEWVEGFYFERAGMHFIIDIGNTHIRTAYLKEDIFDFDLRAFMVDQKTLCQYTGLTDKNGNKIWENDVVKDTEGNIYKCYWCSCNCEYMLDDGVESFGLGYRSEKELEVIGNIFDNPELLGDGE